MKNFKSRHDDNMNAGKGYSNAMAKMTHLLVALVLASVTALGWYEMADAATCFTCHAPVGSTTDIRPVESTYRNITTGSIIGSHAKHIPAATTDRNTCTPCHGTASASYLTKHRDGFINVTTNTTKSLSYSKGARFAQSGDPVTLGYCSTATCHADSYSSGLVASPEWGQAASNCTACHSAYPMTTSGPSADSGTTATGGHMKHMAVSGTVCADCHATGTSATVVPSTNHINGTIDANGTKNTGVAAITKHAAGTYTTICAAATCHANPYATTGSVTTIAWGNTAANCTACHNAYPMTTSGPSNDGGTTATGGHKKHMAVSGTLCTDCHTTGTSATVMPSTNHANGTIDANGTKNTGVAAITKHAAGTYTTTCAAATCHANPYSTTGTITTTAWGSAAANCTACHSAFPMTTSGPSVDGGTTATGGHKKHMAVSGTACTDCHATGTSATAVPSSNHINGTIDANGTKNSGVAAITKHSVASTTICANATCHANPYSTTGTITPTAWGTTTTQCIACHSAYPITVNGPATGAHATHMALAGAACIQCHSAGTSATVAPTTGHIDGNITVTSGYSATVAKHTAGTGYTSCAATACHGATSPTWGATTTNITCAKCHNDLETGITAVTAATRYKIAPGDATATDTGKVSTTNNKIGAHQTHLRYFNGLSAQGVDADARCQVCHGTLPAAGTHATGTATAAYPVFQGLAKKDGTAFSASYSGTGGTCSVYCHNPAGTGGTLNPANAGTGILPSWTNSSYISDAPLKTELNCNRCHKSPGTVAGTITIVGTDHSSIKIADDCAGCHGHNGDNIGSAGQQHMDGIKYGNGNCDTCHGYPPMTAADLAARLGGAYVNAKVDVANGGGHHKLHLLPTVVASQGFTPCLPCHPDSGLGWHNQGGGAVTTANVNVFYAADTGYRFDDSRSKRYKADKTCSNVSCHFQPTAAW